MTSPAEPNHAAQGGDLQDELDELVTACLAELESGGPESLERLLEQHPESAPAAREHLRELHAAGLLDDTGESEHPEQLGDFRLLEPIGSGGMGVVFRAVQESLGREVALKLIRPERLYFPGARERFRREVEVVARLQHPGIVPVYTVGEEGGLPYFAMERVRGASLAAVLAELSGARPEKLTRGDLALALGRACASIDLSDSDGDAGDARPPSGPDPASDDEAGWVDTVLRLVHQIADTLAHTHAEGVLHRDLKPSNMMLAHDLRLLLTDFGLASSRETQSITGSGTVFGSMPYLPPEHLRGEEVGEESDVYSLGVTLYELLALRQPFQARDPDVLCTRILRGETRDLRQLNPAVAWDVATVCATAMELDPARRYPDAASFARDIGHLLAREPIEARRPGSLLRLRRWTQRRPTVAVAIALIAFACVAAPVAYFVVRGRAERELQESAQRAEENLDVALVAIDGLLERSGNADPAELPILQTTRLEMVEEGERLLAELRAQRPDSTDLELRQARLAVARADTLIGLGRPAEGEDGLEGALDTLARLADARPGDLDLGHRRLRAWNLLGSARFALGRSDDAVRAYESGVELGEALTLAHPGAAQAWLELSILQHNAARLRHDSGEGERAFTSIRAAARSARVMPRLEDDQDVERSLALTRALSFEADMLAEDAGPTWVSLHDEALVELEAALARRPEHPRLLVEAIETDNNRGAFYVRRGEVEPARICFDRALGRARRLVELYPDLVSHRVWLGRVQTNRAGHAAQLGDIRSARVHITEAIHVLEELHEARPDVAEFGLALAGALLNAAAMHFAPGTVDVARDFSERSIEVAEAALELAPNDVELSQALGMGLLTLANCMQHAGSYREAEELIRLAGETDLADMDWLRMTGELWVDCANLAADDAGMDPGDRDELVDGYLDEATASFRRAFERGFRDARYLESNPALERLLERDPFLELLGEMWEVP